MSRQEKIGVIFGLLGAALYGVHPIIINKGTQIIPPLTFAAITILLASFVCFLYAILKGKLFELKNRKAYLPVLMVTIFVVIIPSTLFFIGTSKTSGLNSSLLALSEIIFTLVFTHFIGEKTTTIKVVGALSLFIGALLILYNGKLQLNLGDLLIILSASTYPIGNYYAKKALNIISPAIILFLRFLLAGIFMFFLARLIEPQAQIVNIVSNNWLIILITGFIVLAINKFIDYEALRRLDISKANSLFMTYPLFSLIILIGIFKETPTMIQWLGIFVMGIGVYFSIRRTSVDPTLTKYAP